MDYKYEGWHQYNDTGWWVRPFAMFVEEIEIDGQRQPRFAPFA